MLTRFACVAIATIALATEAVHARRIPCASVVRELHQAERYSLNGADPGRVAKRLKTTAAWVERCAEVYGRRLSGGVEGSSRRLVQENVWERGEPEEVSREERETEDDVAVSGAPYIDKERLRAMNRRREDWRPYEHRVWEPDVGKVWSPVLDRARMIDHRAPGVVLE